jgi:hypothetical protein
VGIIFLWFLDGICLGGYVLLSTLAVIFEFIGYRLFMTLVEDNKIFMEI